MSYYSRRKFLYASLGIALAFGMSYLTKNYWRSLIKNTVPHKIESLEIIELNYPRTVRAAETFFVKVIIKHVLHGQKDVFVDLYDNSGLYRGGFYWILKGEGSKVYNLMVTAPLSSKKSWALKVHLQGEYQQSIYIDVKGRHSSPLSKVKFPAP